MRSRPAKPSLSTGRNNDSAAVQRAIDHLKASGADHVPMIGEEAAQRFAELLGAANG